jgi:histidine triad (HIT) family protein
LGYNASSANSAPNTLKNHWPYFAYGVAPAQMASIFTKIINRDVPGYIVAETLDYISFLDIHPLVVGHTLVVPKTEVDYLFDMDDTAFTGLMVFAKSVAIGMHKVIPCLRVGMAVVGLEVPHAHIHLVPLNDLYDIDFKKPKLQQSHAALSSMAKRLQIVIANTTFPFTVRES